MSSIKATAAAFDLPLVKDFPVGDYVLHKGRGTVSTVRRTAYTRGWVK